MQIDEIWRELEIEASNGSASAWLMRFALPKPSQPLMIAIEVASRHRALLLAVSRFSQPHQSEWPLCTGLELFNVDLAGQCYLGVRLRDAACADVFAVLAEDVAPRVASASSAPNAAAILISRLRLWQKFLAVGKAGLSPSLQRGLYGELATLRHHLVPRFGKTTSVAAWHAPHRSHQDFQFNTGAIEVKTTSAKQPQNVTITSERQLDGTGIQDLFLHVVILDERDVLAGAIMSGDSLPQMVSEIRGTLGDTPDAARDFEEKLINAGYLDVHAHR